MKAVLVDEGARIVADAAVEYPTSQPKPGWSEQDAEDWWRGVVTATREAVHQAPGRAVEALAVSTQGDTLVPVDAQGTPLAPARTWMDTRGRELIPAIQSHIGSDRWYQLTGSQAGPYAAAVTIAWLREHRQEVFRAAARFSLVEDFIIQRLTGRVAVDHSNASRTLLFDIHSRCWSPPVLDAIGVEPERLSPAFPSGTIVGELTDDAARSLGLRAGTPVALGGHDQTCAAVGAGVVRPGTMLLSCGTAWVLLAAVDAPRLDPPWRRVQTYCHAAAGQWALLTAQAGGNVLSWFREVLWPEAEGYEEITGAAAEAELRQVPLLLLPHFYGALSPDWMRDARGAIFGLTLSHGRQDVALAVLQGVALEVARNLDTLRAVGAVTDEVRMIGGGAKSDLWAQLVADATGARVVRPQVREAAAFGAALLAGVAAGLFPSVDEMVGAVPARDELAPRLARTAAYQELRARFADACEALRAVWRRT